MTDRQMIEDAALAAGMELLPYTFDKGAPWGEHEGFVVAGEGPDEWDPREDDGQALRLAVAIGPLEFSITEYGTAVRRPKEKWHGREAHLHGGKQAATRLAIVDAAAAIGAKMREAAKEQGRMA